MRTFQQALEYLNTFIDYERQRSVPYPAQALHLDRICALLDRLGNPQRTYPTIHIAGTKGKGSTAAMMESILRAAGYRTGLYTSPHLHTVRERMRVNGESIACESFAALVDEIEPHVAAVAGLTWFEIMTAIAFLHFARCAIRVGVIEVGLGGRFDATNVLTPLVSVIASLSLDHTAWLGDTLDKIAFEKAGIIRPDVPVVSALQKPEALSIIERVAAERNAPLTIIGRDVVIEHLASSIDGQEFRLDASPMSRSAAALSLSRLSGTRFKIPLAGRHQIENAVLALTAIILANGLHVDRDAMASGLADVHWPGRFEIARRNPPLVFDGAHNVDSAQKLAAALKTFDPNRRWTLIFGSSSDKDSGGMLDALLPLVERVIITRAKTARAGDLESIAEMVSDRRRFIEIAESVPEAMARVLRSDAAIVVTGSLYVVAEARAAWFEHIGRPITDRDA